MMKLQKLLQAVVGLAILALGITLSIAVKGPDPWGLFVLSLNGHLPFSLGVTSQIGGLLLILLNLLWGKRKPGAATVMSMVFVGLFIDLFNSSLSFSWVGTIYGNILTLIAGVISLALGISIYVRAGLGEGPVEGMMFVLSRKLNTNVGTAKVVQDFSFLALAWALGQFPQWGTLVTALTVGPMTQGFLSLMRAKKKAPQAP